MNPLETTFWLRPGPLPLDVVRNALRILVGDLPWQPERFGTLARCDRAVVGDDVDAMTESYAKEGKLLIKGPKMEWFFSPDRPGSRTAIGSLSWYWSFGKTPPKDLAERHLSVSTKLARALGSPYTRAGLSSDQRRKSTRVLRVDARSISPDALPGTVEQEVPKVRTYREGLDALYWRNLFGPEFVAMFGDRLRTLPRDVAWDSGDGHWMVQPYAQPAEAFTDQGRAHEHQIIAHLGAECFYDDAGERPPTRSPHFREEIDPLPPLMGFEDAP